MPVCINKTIDLPNITRMFLLQATSRRKRANAKKKATSTLRTAKQNKEADSRTEAKSSIKYHCKQCGAGFAQMNNYFRHLQTHNDSEM